MLRSSIAPKRSLCSALTRQSFSGQWVISSQARRSLSSQGHHYVKSRNVVRSPLGSTPAFTTSAILPNSGDPSARSPAAPSSDSVIPPESVPKPPPSSSPLSQGQTSPGSSVNPEERPQSPKEHSSTPPPSSSPPPPRKPTGRFRRYLLYLLLTSGLAYAGGVWMSLRSDNFHDFFTEFVPYGEDAVLYFEEQDFRRRFPNTARQINRRATEPRDDGKQVTIPSNSGLSWKVSEDEEKGSDVSVKGRHMSSMGADEPSATLEKPKAAAPKAKNEGESISTKPPTEKKTSKEKPAAESAKTDVTEESKQPIMPTTTSIDPLALPASDDATVLQLEKIVNDLITVINSDESSSKFSGPLSKAKEEFKMLGERIISLRQDAHAAAQEEIRTAQTEFDKSATELIRRIDEVRSEEAAQFREEFETEREKLSRSYQEKVKTELQRANEVTEQRLRNELVEQAIELNRKFLGDVEALVERERDGRFSKLSELVANVAELERLTVGWNEVIDTNLRTQQLQIAVDAVRTALESEGMPKPFVNELVAVKELAASDPIVDAAISSISPAAYQRGVPSPSLLVERFRRVASEVRKASLLPEDAGIASHAASYALSKVKFKKEVSTDGDDVESILTRTENLLEEGKLDEAAREMNTLRGWSKLLSKDWLADIRRVLEAKQALEVIETEARLQCLQVES